MARIEVHDTGQAENKDLTMHGFQKEFHTHPLKPADTKPSFRGSTYLLQK